MNNSNTKEEFKSFLFVDKKYSENTLDTKLLYVACTRAIHTLDIIIKQN